KIGLTGASGFIGRLVIELATQRGHEVVAFSRNPEKPVRGCVETRGFSLDSIPDVSGCDVIIHLAGENVFGLWTKAKKRRIRDSRKFGTRRLVDAMLASRNGPRVLVSGSAVGFYGDTGERIADEDAPASHGFLAEVTRTWEAEALRAREAGVRVVLLRTGIVLGKNGGALAAMKPVFQLGLGGKLGTGRQWMPWIHLDDEVALALFAAETESVSGPVNAVSPEPVRNAEFTRELAVAMHRPAVFTVPAFVLRMFTGEFSRELLDSKRIAPRRALDAGFEFRFPTLKPALADALR
ncbi:MAG: uncharacterized protein QOD99_898, partial [Chthoniobacter sp.]|nr:uncharacterized protein [Chthoniobacter sp.]